MLDEVPYTGCFVTSGADYIRLKIMKKKSDKYMSYLSSSMRYNELSVLITFTKDAKK